MTFPYSRRKARGKMDARVKALLPPSTHIWSERDVDLWFVMTCVE
jgi:hypothetical protein